jgi:acetoin utilization deacetylase AcuC-like enzyme
LSQLHLSPITAVPSTDADVLAVHTPAYLARARETSELPAGGQVGHELHMSAGGLEIALLSAGGVTACVRAVLEGSVRNAYALVRPPGHHAESDGGHGFCVFNNVAIAAEVALASIAAKEGRRGRVAVVDIDVHHGNGTENSYLERDDLLFISLHQCQLYPLDTGAVDVVGKGAGRGYNLNIPLPPGTGEGGYVRAFERVVEPALRAYRPDIIIVSCGFDASFLDPLGRMMLTSASFRLITQRLMAVAADVCGGKLVFAHEGGYSQVYVPYCGIAVLEALSGQDSGIKDPFIADVGSPAWQACAPHCEAVIERAAENLAIALMKA